MIRPPIGCDNKQLRSSLTQNDTTQASNSNFYTLQTCITVRSRTRNSKVIWEEPRRYPPPRTAENNYTTRSPLVTMECPTFTLKAAPSLRRSPPHLIYPFVDRPHSPHQTASRSNQPFCHNTPPDRPTDRQTDKRQTVAWDWRQVSTKSRLRSIVSDAAKTALCLKISLFSVTTTHLNLF